MYVPLHLAYPRYFGYMYMYKLTQLHHPKKQNNDLF